jgi:hypothetical protein
MSIDAFREGSQGNAAAMCLTHGDMLPADWAWLTGSTT